MKLNIPAFKVTQILPISSFAIVCITLCHATSADAKIIRQESYRSNNVLVARPVNEDRRIQDIIAINNISSAAEYQKWLKVFLRYRKDPNGDQWQLPENMLARGNGDCEDYAFLNEAVLRKLGYEPQVWALGKKAGPGHAVCVFKLDGYYHIFDNTNLIRTGARSQNEIARQIISVLKYDHIARVNINLKNHYMSI